MPLGLPAYSIEFPSLVNMKTGIITDNSFYKNGRAILFPVYKSSFERTDNIYDDIFSNLESAAYKDLMIMWITDISRCIDYLETRDDIDINKIAYVGTSLGAANGAIIPAVEKSDVQMTPVSD